MKKLLFSGVLLILISIYTVVSAENRLNIVSENGQLKVIGTQLCNNVGEPLILRGVSLGWSNEWGMYYNKDVVNTLVRDWKVSVIRASMGVSAENCYLKNPEYALKCVTNVVDQAIKEGVYVIIDFHSHVLLTKEASKFFAKMSAKYGKYPNVIYEIFNEPIKQSWPKVKTYAETVIDVIRKNDPDNIILVGTPHWDQDIHLAAADPILNRTNIMYTVHFYAATHKDQLRNRTQKALDAGIPVFISECAGMEASGDGFLDVNEWNTWVEWMEKNKLSWACWSVTPKVETCSMLVPNAPVNGQWTEDQIKPWGKIVKQNIQQLNTNHQNKNQRK